MLLEVDRLAILLVVPVPEAHLAEAAAVMVASVLIVRRVRVVAEVPLSATSEVLGPVRLVAEVEHVQADPCALEAVAVSADN